MLTGGPISQPVRDLFKRLDTDKNGLTVKELGSIDTSGDGTLTPEEAQAAGITQDEDIGFLNEALAKAQSTKMNPTELAFDLPAYEQSVLDIFSPATYKGSVVNQQSDNAFNARDPFVFERMDSLETSLNSGKPNAIKSTFMKAPAIDPTSFAPWPSTATPLTPALRTTLGLPDPQKTIPFHIFNGVTKLSEISGRAVTYMQQQFPGMSEADAKQYLKDNIDSIAQQMGEDMGSLYTGAIKMAGDVTGFSGFQPVTPGAGVNYVCSDVHEALGILRQELAGQETYVLSSDQNDKTHLIMAYKTGDGKWNLQNYGHIQKTDTTDLRSLTQNAIPGQRHLRLYKPTSDGGLEMVRNTPTDMGQEDRRIRTKQGTGAPISPYPSVEISSRNAYVNTGDLQVSFDGQQGRLTVESSKPETIADGTSETGWAFIGRSNGYNLINGDAKLENTTTQRIQNEDGSVLYKQTYQNVHTGGEGVNSPAHQENGKQTDVLWRAGAYYNSQAMLSKPLPITNLSSELGYQLSGGITLSTSLNHDFIATFGGRSLYDITAQANVFGGLAYDPLPGLSTKAGIRTGFNGSNLYGMRYEDIPRQMGSMLTLDAYGQALYQNGPVDAGLMATWNLKQPELFRVGMMGQYRLNQNLNASGLLFYSNDPLLGNKFGLRASVMGRPLEQVMTGGSIGIFNDGTINTDLQVRYLY